MNGLGRVGRSLYRHLTPPRIFILSFAAIILIGTVLLLMPFSSSRGHLGFVDALFSSASAVCVTGLIVIDVGRDLSFAGQIVTLLLFQIGGLGIITFSVLLFSLMGRGISFTGREIVQSTFLHTPRRDLLLIVKEVCRFAMISEAVGTLLLFLRFLRDFPPATAFYHALYNAVSAFNNCGYSLFSDSLNSYRGDWVVNLTVMGLIVRGGIGFIVQQEVFWWFRGFQKRLSLHS
jgi:trk system potassium uptake protein TrkH